jgi:hypothetical protein
LRVARLAGRPLERFLRIEASSGILLLVASAVALAWANSPWADSYCDLWHTPLGIRIGTFTFERTFEWFVNDGLMSARERIPNATSPQLNRRLLPATSAPCLGHRNRPTYARAVKRPVRELLGDWVVRFSKCSIDAESGFMVQRVESGRCTPRDAPRGSGTAVASYFTSFVDPALSGKLHAALAEHGTARLLGFSALREYAPEHTGSGDGNSGPVIFGVSVGATGFGLASAKLHRDRELFEGLYRTAHLFGMPFDTAEGRGFAAGGALGNALLLAMLTARSP